MLTPGGSDIHIDSFTLLFHGHELLQDCRMELNYGRRYGLLGLNGCGKSCLLKALAAREVRCMGGDLLGLGRSVELRLQSRDGPFDKGAADVGCAG